MKPSHEVQSLIAEYFRAAAGGDTAWIRRHISARPETRFVGSDPTEWFTGPDAVEFLASQAEALGGAVRVDPGHPDGYEEGDIGWGLTTPTLTLPGGQVVPLRWSAVLHRQDGAWEFVQIHSSIGIPNAEIGSGEG